VVSANAVALLKKQLERPPPDDGGCDRRPAFGAAIRAAGLKVAPGALGSVISISPGMIAILQTSSKSSPPRAGPQPVVRAPWRPRPAIPSMS